MKFSLKIDMDNAAFHDGSEYSNELIRLIEVVQSRIKLGLDAGNLRDINGNHIGCWFIGEEDDE